MNIYYIDYENVSSQGLKGVEALTENDEVILLYSKKADNVKIDILTTLMASRAKIRFVPVHVGTPNALDFQLVTLLFLNYKEEDHCYIISKDSGYDCCIKTAAENGAPNVARFPNIESAVNGTPAKKSRKGKRSMKDADTASNAAPENASAGSAQNGNNQAGAGHTITPQSGAAQAGGLQSGSVSSDQVNHSNHHKETPDPAPSKQETPAAAHEGSPSGEENAKKKPARRRSRKKTSSSEDEGVQASGDGNQSKVSVQTSGDGNQPKASEPEKPHEQEKGQEKVQEHVLQQRYLSKQFDQRSTANSAGSKPDSDKPVSILSVIRRRNDVQLDMHQIDLIREALKNSSNKQQFYSYFVKQLGQKQGIELYHSVKSSYTDLVNANLI